ncbi:Ctr-domain-containing protein [Dothidotthia symphoricarpi CBS 119687]|uniref:Copper transport protein n=1 Tax=Dothidotthia symphoricarpi CBS 119687 TaxID=1392245 RepID=A0A6A5ZX18_9PLEO|nr:Ctr-domain-containing protein [Dothidotthia symphoricarpi CBS 119687]KAF2124079.1 Ctr-domain-containing protein [Dothidotthia symphoricarpi CBS 119687]
MNHGSSNVTSMASSCVMEMTWNWRIVDSCFLADSWHITNNGMFAASCIGVALLVVCLEFLRRVGHEYDALLTRQFQRRVRAQQAALAAATSSNCCDGPASTLGTQFVTFRATGLQQLVRAILHGVTLGLAYIIMLIVMSFNGYMFISIVLGGILGKFLCDWLVVRIETGVMEEKDERRFSVEAAGPTGCCA